MSRWLIKYYPVNPANNLEVFNLDVLDYEDYCSENYQNMVREKLDDYLDAVSRHGKDKESGYVYWNNSCLKIVEADDIKEALDNFFI